MDTAKPLNPSSKADAADDLIEELARLMADDAQLKTPSAASKAPGTAGAPPSGNAGPGSAGVPSNQNTAPQTGPQGAGAQGAGAQGSGTQGSGFVPSSSQPSDGASLDGATSEVVPPVRSFAAPTPPASKPAGAQGSTKPDFNFKDFSLNTPKASISEVKPAPPAAPAQPPQPAKPSKAAAPDSPGADPVFDFGFGAGNGAASQNPPGQEGAGTGEAEKAAQAPDSLVDQSSSDPIADLINAAVSKHKEPATSQPKPPVSPSVPAPDTKAPDGAGGDKFTSPPVFGVQGTPEATPPAARTGGGSSALDEIEALIGNSVQVAPTGDKAQNQSPDANASTDANAVERGPADLHAQQAVEGPAAQSATSGNLSENLAAEFEQSRDEPSKTQSAESTILQAMAAAGTAASEARAAGQVVPELRDHDLAPADDADRPQTQADVTIGDDAAGQDTVAAPAEPLKLKRFVVPAVGVLFLAAIGLGGYMLLNPGEGQTDAPVLQADNAPVRETPAPVAQNEQSAVLNEIDGASPSTAQEQLVSRDETQGETPTTIRQVIATNESEAGLANRRVRTVTVRPDGTIVSGDAAVAGGEVLPVAQPNLPELPSDAINTELSNTTVAALPATPQLLPDSAPTGANNSLALAPNRVSTQDPDVPFPRERLTNRAALAAAAVSTPAPAQPVTLPQGNNSLAVNLLANNAAAATSNSASPATTTPAPVAAQPATSPGAFVQLASQRSEAVANQTAATMQARFSSALSGRSLIVRRVDLGARGIYYRVQLPTASLTEANSVCNAIKAAGGDCFTRNS